MTHPSWVALHGMVHSFIELLKPLCHDKAVIHEGVRIDTLKQFMHSHVSPLNGINWEEWLVIIVNSKSNDLGFPGGSVVNNPLSDAGDMGSIPGPGRSHTP